MQASQTCFVLICGYARQAQACAGGVRHRPGLYVYHGGSGGPATFSRPPITTKLFLFSFFFLNTRLGTKKTRHPSCVLTTAGLRTREKNTLAHPALRTADVGCLCETYFLVYGEQQVL